MPSVYGVNAAENEITIGNSANSIDIIVKVFMEVYDFCTQTCLFDSLL